MTRIIGIDYGSTVINLAVLEDAKVIETMRLDVPNPVDTWINNFGFHLIGADAVYCEAPWSREIPGVRSDTGVKQSRVAALVEAAAGVRGIPFYLVYPQTWRSVVYGKGKGTPRATAAKELAINYVWDHYEYWQLGSLTKRSYTPDHNEAEAICIATYGGFKHDSFA